MGKTKQLFRDPDHPRVICPVQLIRDFVAVPEFRLLPPYSQ